jgi:hypothetical protein
MGCRTGCPLNTCGKPSIAGGNPISEASKMRLMHCILQYIKVKYNHEANRLNTMASQRPKVKTATMTLRVDPKIKAAAEAAAEREHRSITSLIEVLILNHCRSLGLITGQNGKE